MRGRPPVPIEVHRQRGTYRADRHGPKLQAVARPSVWLSLPPGDVQDYRCMDCDQQIVLDLYTDHVWRLRHAAESTCEGLP